jgi:ribosome-associated protein
MLAGGDVFSGLRDPSSLGSFLFWIWIVSEAPRTAVPADVKQRSLVLAMASAKVALENRANGVMVLDVSGQTSLFDYFVIATGSSRRQLKAISDEIDDVLQKQLGDRRLNVAGFDESRWIVLDYGSIVIHLFDEETRSYYDLESLWADAQPVDLASLAAFAPRS